MNNFVKGLLFGVGVGLLIAPMKGEELRKLVGERVGEIRGYLPESDQLDAYKNQLSGRMTQTASVLKDYAQQAATTVKSSASNLSTIAQNAAGTIKNSAQDTADDLRRTNDTDTLL